MRPIPSSPFRVNLNSFEAIALQKQIDDQAASFAILRTQSEATPLPGDIASLAEPWWHDRREPDSFLCYQSAPDQGRHPWSETHAVLQLPGTLDSPRPREEIEDFLEHHPHWVLENAEALPTWGIRHHLPVASVHLLTLDQVPFKEVGYDRRWNLQKAMEQQHPAETHFHLIRFILQPLDTLLLRLRAVHEVDNEQHVFEGFCPSCEKITDLQDNIQKCYPNISENDLSYGSLLDRFGLPRKPTDLGHLREMEVKYRTSDPDNEFYPVWLAILKRYCETLMECSHSRENPPQSNPESCPSCQGRIYLKQLYECTQKRSNSDPVAP